MQFCDVATTLMFVAFNVCLFSFFFKPCPAEWLLQFEDENC